MAVINILLVEIKSSSYYGHSGGGEDLGDAMMFEENLNTLLTKVVTPTSSGNFTYTLSAYNTANSSVTRDVSVNIENDPTFTDFKVNGQNSINVETVLMLLMLGYQAQHQPLLELLHIMQQLKNH